MDEMRCCYCGSSDERSTTVNQPPVIIRKQTRLWRFTLGTPGAPVNSMASVAAALRLRLGFSEANLRTERRPYFRQRQARSTLVDINTNSDPDINRVVGNRQSSAAGSKNCTNVRRLWRQRSNAQCASLVPRSRQSRSRQPVLSQLRNLGPAVPLFVW